MSFSVVVHVQVYLSIIPKQTTKDPSNLEWSLNALVSESTLGPFQIGELRV